MRIAVLGCGSIGRRHLKNLQTLGATDLLAYDPSLDARARVWEDLGINGVAELDEIWHQDPALVVITAPSNLHVALAEQAALHGCDLFVEKPLSHSLSGVGELCAKVDRRKLITMVGCNMRFHPGPAKVKELIDGGRLGKILFARLQTGSYLPNWRPTQDYRLSYSSSSYTGGGCILDCIHEIDLARWFLGEVDHVFCMSDHLSSLEIDSEDVAAIICRHAERSVSEIHLDYVQRTYERDCQIVGELGSIFWNFNNGTTRWFDAQANTWETFVQPPGWQVNKMYLDELEHFLECVSERKQTVLPVSEAARVLEIALAAHESAKSGRMVSTEAVYQ